MGRIVGILNTQLRVDPQASARVPGSVALSAPLPGHGLRTLVAYPGTPLFDAVIALVFRKQRPSLVVPDLDEAVYSQLCDAAVLLLPRDDGAAPSRPTYEGPGIVAEAAGGPSPSLNDSDTPNFEAPFALLDSVGSTAQVDSTAGYLQALALGGFMERDGRVGRWGLKDDGVGQAWHRLWTGRLEAMGLAVEPTFNWACVYDGGAFLPEHTDRHACDWTLSWMLSPPPQPWPLNVRLDPGAAAVPVVQGLGQAALLRGREIPHGRPRLAADEQAICWFFHWNDVG